MSFEKEKRDFRRGNRAIQRTVEAMNAIRDALSEGELTFGGIMEKTGLSRRGLSLNLERLRKQKEVRRRVDLSDRRLVCYSLTDLGWKKYSQQKVSQILKRIELTTVGDIVDIIIKSMVDALAAVTEVTNLEQQKLGEKIFPKLTKDEATLFEGCLRGRIYAYTHNNEITSYVDALKEFLAMIKLVAAKKEIDIKLLMSLSDVCFEFKFSKDKLIEQYDAIRRIRDNSENDARK